MQHAVLEGRIFEKIFLFHLQLNMIQIAIDCISKHNKISQPKACN